ncbi:MAG: hypothetical protein J2P17_36200 [Mycobacterium sp.]|nr:hypothetical protein [Mycobacterium sp.]
MLGMDHIVAMNHHTGTRLAEVAFLLLLFAGLWLIVASRFTAVRAGAARSIVAGLAIGGAGVLLIIAAHWGHFN